MFRKCVATVFVFFCDVKYSDSLWGSSHVRCYLLKPISRLFFLMIFVYLDVELSFFTKDEDLLKILEELQKMVKTIRGTVGENESLEGCCCSDSLQT